jgi:catechol 2,3-dioxygenase-like lactoylglutathione lyase family enzyme
MVSILVDDPIKAHKYYTEVLGFVSKEFNPEAQIAVIVSPEDPDGTSILLEPRGESFAKEYQEQLYKSGLPIMVFEAEKLTEEIYKLKAHGVKFRDDLAKPEWGLQNLFEDTCGNLLMLQGSDKKK